MTFVAAKFFYFLSGFEYLTNWDKICANQVQAETNAPHFA